MNNIERAYQVVNDIRHLKHGIGSARAWQVIADAIDEAVVEAEQKLNESEGNL